MSTWHPSQYLKFSDSRTRPAVELLARVPLDSPSRVVDLGCGTGNSTELLAQRWPNASIRGVDNSGDMLLVARKAHPDWVWEESDIASWVPKEPLDLIFSNAALHWLPHHEILLPHLMSRVAGGGAMAIQMPCNFAAPAHRLILQTAADGPWQDILADLDAWNPPMEPAGYYAILAPHCQSVDIWETEYVHVMDNAAVIAEWTKGSALRPFLDRLAVAAQRSFLARYTEALQAAYPPQPDGRVLFPFRRIFLVALRKS